MDNRSDAENPLRRLDDWEEFVEARYPVPEQKPREDYRNYNKPARDTVRDFYRLNHRYQTYEFVSLPAMLLSAAYRLGAAMDGRAGV